MQDEKAIEKEIELVVSSEELDELSCNGMPEDRGTTQDPVATSKDKQSTNDYVTSTSPARTETKSSYECEYLSLRIHDALEKCMKQGRAKEADLLSRLLVDVNDNTCDTPEVTRVLEMIESKFSSQSTSKTTVDPAQSASNGKKLLVFCLTFSLTFICGVMLIRMLSQPIGTPPAVTKAAESPYNFFVDPPEGKPDLLVSHASDTKSLFRLVNTTKKPLSVYWHDYGGDRVHYFDLAPGARQTQQTYSTHPWELVDESGKTVLWFVAGTNPMLDIDISRMLNVISSVKKTGKPPAR